MHEDTKPCGARGRVKEDVHEIITSWNRVPFGKQGPVFLKVLKTFDFPINRNLRPAGVYSRLKGGSRNDRKIIYSLFGQNANIGKSAK
jgi:hypothetical protein